MCDFPELCGIFRADRVDMWNIPGIPSLLGSYKPAGTLFYPITSSQMIAVSW